MRVRRIGLRRTGDTWESLSERGRATELILCAAATNSPRLTRKSPDFDRFTQSPGRMLTPRRNLKPMRSPSGASNRAYEYLPRLLVAQPRPAAIAKKIADCSAAGGD